MYNQLLASESQLLPIGQVVISQMLDGHTNTDFLNNQGKLRNILSQLVARQLGGSIQQNNADVAYYNQPLLFSQLHLYKKEIRRNVDLERGVAQSPPRKRNGETTEGRVNTSKLKYPLLGENWGVEEEIPQSKSSKEKQDPIQPPLPKKSK